MSAALRRRRPVGIDRERWPARRWSPVGRDVAWRLLPAGNDVDVTMGNYLGKNSRSLRPLIYQYPVLKLLLPNSSLHHRQYTVL